MCKLRQVVLLAHLHGALLAVVTTISTVTSEMKDFIISPVSNAIDPFELKSVDEHYFVV